MVPVYIAADNIITSLGFTTDENLENIKKNKTGIKINTDKKLSQTPFYTSVIDSEKLHSEFEKLTDLPEFEKPGRVWNKAGFTKLEKMFILSITNASQKIKNIKDKKTLLIISTTKGNIDLLAPENKNKFDNNRINLWETAKLIQQYFEVVSGVSTRHLSYPNQPLVISHACISGLVAIIVGMRLIQSGQYENVIITGGDIVSEFAVSGFQSLKAISTEPCKPFDKDRNGLTLGDGCGTIILTSNSELTTGKMPITVLNGSTTNDANHISGPSRTGEGLYLAIKNTVNSVKNIDYISAHGTATIYNDEMEAKAISLAGLEKVPVNSFKGFWGHTQGAAGIIESIAAIHSLKENILFNTIGFNKLGVSKNINVIAHRNAEKKIKINNCLKLASGFGGSNAAVLFSKKLGN